LYKGVEIPIYWLILNKQGSSNQKERQRFIHQFDRENILGILGGERVYWRAVVEMVNE